MSVLCACGQPATHRTRWNQWTEVVEPLRSSSPSRCYACSVREAQAQTAQARSEREFERSFNDADRLVFRTDTPVPQKWIRVARQCVLRHAQAINPGGLIKVSQKDRYLFVEVYPPHERPETWTPANALYSMRYLMRLPLFFVEVKPEDDERTSPATWRESRRPWTDSAPAPVLTEPN